MWRVNPTQRALFQFLQPCPPLAFTPKEGPTKYVDLSLVESGRVLTSRSGIQWHLQTLLQLHSTLCRVRVRRDAAHVMWALLPQALARPRISRRDVPLLPPSRRLGRAPHDAPHDDHRMDDKKTPIMLLLAREIYLEQRRHELRC
jgi:hypothetical protein